MSDPSISPLTSSAAPPMSDEPVSTAPPTNETLACVNPSADEGASGPGAQALVERFGGNQGAGGNGQVPEEPEIPTNSSCRDNAMAAVGTCGAAIAAASASAGVLTVAAAIGCIGALDGYAECLLQERAPRSRP